MPCSWVRAARSYIRGGLLYRVVCEGAEGLAIHSSGFGRSSHRLTD